MYLYRGIRVVHLEITSRCNASCPMCPRNVEGGRGNPNLPLTELSLADVKAIFPEDFIGQLDQMYMCGNYGDPMVAKDTLEVFQHFRDRNAKMKLKICTNGSGRDAAWWGRIAKVVDAGVFAIDGLEDTNHLYRRGTDWGKIMTATGAFIAAGGRAEWEFLVFKHNEHQVEQARELSKKLGFAKFTVKKTERFLVDGKQVQQRAVLNAQGEVEYYLERPTAPQLQNAAAANVDAMKGGQAYKSYVETTTVTCKAEQDSKVYVSAEGLVFPCCWTGGLYNDPKKARASEIWKLLESLPGGTDALDAKKHSLESIVDGPFFQKLIPATWVADSQDRKDFKLCARACGAHDVKGAIREPVQA